MFILDYYGEKTEILCNLEDPEITDARIQILSGDERLIVYRENGDKTIFDVKTTKRYMSEYQDEYDLKFHGRFTGMYCEEFKERTSSYWYWYSNDEDEDDYEES